MTTDWKCWEDGSIIIPDTIPPTSMPPTSSPIPYTCAIPRIDTLEIFQTMQVTLFFAKAGNMKDTAFRQGENITIYATNRPWDMTGPPESSDYQSAQMVNLKVVDPCDYVFYEGSMCEVPNQPGRYFYNIQTDSTSRKGLWKVYVTLGCYYDGCTATPPTTGIGTSGTTGTSGSPTLIKSEAIGYFRLLDRTVL